MYKVFELGVVCYDVGTHNSHARLPLSLQMSGFTVGMLLVVSSGSVTQYNHMIEMLAVVLSSTQ